MTMYRHLRASTEPAHSVMESTWPLHRKCSCGGSTEGECESCGSKGVALRRQSGHKSSPPLVPQSVHEVLRSSGMPLDSSARNALEPGLGHEFSKVRVHTDRRAVESAAAIHADAYTVGRHIVFGASQYAPATTAGRRLIAHELTHAVQQGFSDNHHGRELRIVPAEHESEVQARHAENQASAGPVAKATGSYSTAIARRPTDGGPSLTGPSAGDAGSPGPGGEVLPPDAGTLTGNAIPLKDDTKAVTTPCPKSVSIDTVSQFNHSNLSAADQDAYRTYLGAISRMKVGPGPDHSGHCMKETLTTVSNDCPEEVYKRGETASSPCGGNRCLDINTGKSMGDARTHSMLADGPTSFLDLHRTFNPRSLLEGTGKKECSVVCEQTYACDRQGSTTGKFRITRNYKAGTHTTTDGTSVHITTGSVTKTDAPASP